jgi:hypothetical protein
MTNSEKIQLIQQYEHPNSERIESLCSNDHHPWDEAKHIDALERREAVLLELGARGTLDEEQHDELADVQQTLRVLVANGARLAGISFDGDGQATGTPTLVIEKCPTCPRCGGDGSAEVSHARGTETHTCSRCKGTGSLRPIRFDLPFLRTKSSFPLREDRWRVTFEVRCFAPQNEGYWSLRGPIVEERDAICTVLWDAHEEAARSFQAEAQQHARRKADRLLHQRTLHEQAKHNVDRHRALVESGGDDRDGYCGVHS